MSADYITLFSGNIQSTYLNSLNEFPYFPGLETHVYSKSLKWKFCEWTHRKVHVYLHLHDDADEDTDQLFPMVTRRITEAFVIRYFQLLQRIQSNKTAQPFKQTGSDMFSNVLFREVLSLISSRSSSDKLVRLYLVPSSTTVSWKCQTRIRNELS